MNQQISTNKYALFLKEQGNYVVNIRGVDWYGYGGFMMPAYLPHCTPDIPIELAEQVLKISGRPFVRWDSRFGKVDNSDWWYILKRGPWSIENVKNKKKRWMIRQGKKHFSVRPLTSEEVLEKCPNVAQLATARYKGCAEIETSEILQKRIETTQKVYGVLEYLGCFYEDTLASFSENYIQDNGVWLANMRHDPGFLNKYLSYGFLDGILDYYLNRKKLDYVLDGCRSIHHRTKFQEHLVKVFGFSKEYASLNLMYSTKFKIAVTMAYPFRKAIWFFCDKWINGFTDNVGAVLKQEYIRRSCERL
ncbi:hypothetical protein ACFL3G_08210 [Planctomycetota bacterium]